MNNRKIEENKKQDHLLFFIIYIVRDSKSVRERQKRDEWLHSMILSDAVPYGTLASVSVWIFTVRERTRCRSVNCNWADPESSQLSCCSTSKQRPPLLTLMMEMLAEGRERHLAASSGDQAGHAFLGTAKEIQLIKNRKFSLTFSYPLYTIPLLSSFLSLTFFSQLWPSGQRNFMVDTDFFNRSNFNPVRSVPKAQKVSD